MRRRVLMLALAGLVGAACSSQSAGTLTPGAETDSPDGSSVDGAATSDDLGTDATTAVVTETVGAAGGTVTAGPVLLTIPAGALASDTAITVTASGASAPAAYDARSPVFSFGPAGTTFLVPVTITIGLSVPAAGASIFWSNASGGFDALATTVTADSASADVSRLGDAFVGELRDRTDAQASSDAGLPADGGALPDSGSGDATSSDAAVLDGAVVDASTPVDASPPDAGPAAITATVDGSVTAFAYNTTVTALQAWWKITADDSPSSTHWTLQLVVPTNAETLSCGSLFPSATYTHFTGGSSDAVFAANPAVGGSCGLTETTTATAQGQHATGTLSGTLARAADAGSPTSHALTSASYDVIVP